MAEDISSLIAILKQFRDELPQVLPAVATSISMTGKALAERTIKDKGFGADYSTKTVPAWFLKGKELNARGANFIYEQSLDEIPTNWKELREVQGLQSKYVDLTYSGKMWAGMFPQDVEVNLFQYTAPLGNNTVEGQSKMNWNYARYGDFIGSVLVGENFDLMADVAYDEFIRIMDAKLGWKKD